jgi:cellulose synthase (UDP-forming)
MTGPGPQARQLAWPLRGLCRILLAGALTLAVAVLFYLAMVEMSWPQQAVLALVLMTLAFGLDRSSKSHLITLTMMGMSLFATCR